MTTSPRLRILAVALAATVSLALAPVASAETNDWGQSAAQYSTYLNKLVEFPGTLKVRASLAAKPQRASYKSRAAYRSAVSRYQQQLAKDEAAAQKDAQRAAADLQRLVDRASQDAQDNLDARNAAIQYSYQVAQADIDNRRNQYEAQRDASYANAIAGNETSTDQALTTSQATYDQAVKDITAWYNSEWRRLDSMRDSGDPANKNTKYEGWIVDGKIRSVNNCKKVYDTKKEAGQLKDCQAKANDWFTLQINGDPHGKPVGLNKQKSDKLAQAQTDKAARDKAAQSGGESQSNALDQQYGFDSGSSDFDAEDAALQNKLDLALARSQRMFTDETRQIEDAQTTSTRLIEDLYNVELS